MADWAIKQGDSTVIDDVVRQRPTAAQLVGDPVDLTGLTGLHVAIQRMSDNEIVFDAAGSVIDASAGEIAFPVSADDSMVAGLYRIEYVLTWPGNLQRTYPLGRRFKYLDVRPDIAASASPTQTTPPTVGGTPVQGSLFVADGATAEVTTQGQVVFAGATSTVSVASHVETFTISPWSTQTDWAVGNTPTITQPGATFDTSVTSFMEASTGDAVIIAKDTDANRWYGASSSVGSSVLEIGQGSTLPANGDVYQLFDLESHPVLPNGIYRWDADSTSWVGVD